MLTHPKVILLSSNEAETSVLEGILSEHVILKSVRNLWELKSLLEDDIYDAVFCGRSFHQGTWKVVLGQVRQRFPDLPVIIFCHTGGEKEWVEALEAGAFDLLVAPYMKRNVLPLLEHAVVSHEARRLHNFASHMEAKTS